MQAVDVLVRGETSVTLTEYIIVFGCANLILAQCPHFHAIRYINAVATVCTISFAIIAVAMSLYSGKAPQRKIQMLVRGKLWLYSGRGSNLGCLWRQIVVPMRESRYNHQRKLLRLRVTSGDEPVLSQRLDCPLPSMDLLLQRGCMLLMLRPSFSGARP